MNAEDGGFLSRWARRKAQVRDGREPAVPQDPPPGAPAVAAAPTAPATPAATGPAAEALPAEPAPPPPTLDDVAALTEAGATIAAVPADAQPHVETRQPPERPPPTLAEAQSLTHDDDFTRFVGRNVDPEVKNAALKTLFNDPHFNVMDGLDTYIDDYGKPDPLPPGMLRQMVQSAMLGLFADEATQAPAAGTPPAGAPDAPPSLPAALPSDTAAPQPHAPSDEDTDLRLQPHDDAGRPGAEPGAGEDPGRQR